MKTTHLIGYGEHKATEVKNLKVGDTIVWNYGYESIVKKLTPSKTGKTIKVLFESGITRNLKSTRLIAVAGI